MVRGPSGILSYPTSLSQTLVHRLSRRGRPPLHIGSIASLRRPWAKYTFPTRDLVGLPRPLSLPSLPTKADYNPERDFPLPPSDNEAILFSDESKTVGKVGAAFIHFHATTRSFLHLPVPTTTQTGNDTAPHSYSSNSITGSHLLSLPRHMSILMQNCIPPAARSSMPHPSLPRPGSLA